MGTAQQTVVQSGNGPVTGREPSYVARMSVKSIGCRPEGGDKPKLLCQIYGKATGTKSGEDKIRENRVWTCLSGSFAAINLETGEEFRSARLFLPDGIQEVIENAVNELKDGKGDEQLGLHIDFAMEFYSVKASNPAGYTYQVKNILPTEKKDELSEMQKSIQAARAARPALLEAPSEQTPQSKKK